MQTNFDNCSFYYRTAMLFHFSRGLNKRYSRSPNFIAVAQMQHSRKSNIHEHLRIESKYHNQECATSIIMKTVFYKYIFEICRDRKEI